MKMLGSMGKISVLMMPSGVCVAGIIIIGVIMLNVGIGGLVAAISRYLGLEMLGLGLGCGVVGVRYSRVLLR